MKRLPYIITIILILAACANSGRERAALDAAQAVINDRPDSALAILDSLEPSSQDFSRNTLRRWQLLRFMAQNKCDTVFRSDSLQLILTDYYDRHGTPNEKMWAHYLLGRAYFDMGEALPALKAYEDAAAAADTASADCDYWNLCRVYSQLSELYHQSFLPEEMLSSLCRMEYEANKAGDIVSSIIATARKALAYELKDNGDSVIICVNKAYQLFQSHELHSLAAQYLSMAIPYELRVGNLTNAKDIINIYETQSGFFDNQYEIDKGHEIYYHSKGMYYLAAGLTDSAELVFRKLLHRSVGYNERHAAFSGLAAKFQKTGPLDSLSKYAVLSEQYNDSLFLQRYRADLLRSQQMFNYTRYIKASEKSALESKRKSKIISFSIIAFLLVLFAFIVFYFYSKIRRKELLMEYKEKMHQLNVVKMEKTSIISEKEKEVARLTQKTRNLQIVIGQDVEQDLEHQLTCSVIVKRIKEIEKMPDSKLTEKDWQILDELFDKEYPNFRVALSKKKIFGIEYRLCQLIRIGLSPSSISSLLNKDSSYASTVRRRLFNNVMKTTGKAKDWDNYLFSIPRV